jgi:uncharacterized membrane protein YkoI
MSRKLALLTTAALTTLVLITVFALAIQLRSSPEEPQSVPADAFAAETSSLDLEVIKQREQEYRLRIEEANARLLELQDQNSVLLDRESAYQQEIQKANALLAQGAASSKDVALVIFEDETIISEDEAISIAQQYTGGGNVREVEIEHEHGALVYEIEIGHSEIYIDAYSGEILYSEYDDDDDDDDDRGGRRDKDD